MPGPSPFRDHATIQPAEVIPFLMTSSSVPVS